MIVPVKAKDLEVGMECVGPVLFPDYGTVMAVERLQGIVLVTLDGNNQISRDPDYVFDVLDEPSPKMETIVL